MSGAIRHLPISLAILLATFAALPSGAVKADPRPKEVTQPDGTKLTLQLIGDEHHHFFRMADGTPVARDKDGFFRKITIQEAEEAASSKAKRRTTPQKTSYPATGEGRGIVVLAEYQDVKFRSADPNTDFYRMLNEPGYSDNGGTGSAAEWFADNSMGRFTPKFDVYGPITLAHDMAYYGANNAQGDDINAHYMAIEACQQLDPEVDFTIYDRDGDGFIDNIYIFYAGYGENLGGDAPEESVWPHSWNILEATTFPYMFDGVRLNHYACSNELDLDNVMDGIGTFCHEFSHVLGLPDLYATNYSYAFTPGDWSVMDSGSYNNNNRTPPFYTAYERYALGWLDPRELRGPANVKLDHIGTNNACIIRTSKENEYFLFENRQQTGWDKYLPYHGMLIWHIDYNENVWNFNTVNNSASHQYVDIEEADDLPYWGSIDGDPFPGTANVTSFTDDTTPGMLSWNGERQEKPITEIQESNGYIYFKVCGGKEETSPVNALQPTEIGIDFFTAAWEEGDFGCDYCLSVFTMEDAGEGKTRIQYVDGYDNLNVGEATQFRVEGLQPATEYSYTVTAYERDAERYSTASNRIDLTTLPPTFDYLRPQLSEAEEITSNSFSLSWSGIEEAETYLLEIYTKEYGDAEEGLIDFTGGLSAMPSGWYTPSNFTYGADDYCGNAAPSLRLNSTASYIQSGVYTDCIRGISFWHRGVGTSSEDRIAILAPDNNDGSWKKIAETPISDAESGQTVCFDDIIENPEWPGSLTCFRLSLETSGKGAVAIDDITVYHGGDVSKHYTPFDGAVDTQGLCHFEVSGLMPSTAYWAVVTAKAGELFSKPSEEKRIITAIAEENAIDKTAAERGMTAYLSGGTLYVRDAQGTHIKVYGIDGTLLQRAALTNGECSLTLSGTGVYIVSDGVTSVKIKTATNRHL